MQFQRHFNRRDIDVKIYDSYNRQKVTGQYDERKNSLNEERERSDKTKHIRKGKQKEYNTRGPGYNKRKKLINEEPIQRREKFSTRPRTKFTGTRSCRFCNKSNWNILHKCPALEWNGNHCGEKGHFERACRQRNNKRTVKKNHRRRDERIK